MGSDPDARQLAAILITACFVLMHSDADSHTRPAVGGPSLPVTEAWLQDHLPTFAFGLNTFEDLWEVQASYKFRGCILHMSTSSILVKLGPSAPGEHLYYLSFAPARGIIQLDEDVIVPDSTGASFDGKRLLESTDVNLGDLSGSDADMDLSTVYPGSPDSVLPPIGIGPKRLGFGFEDRALAERVRQAMKHAIMLCGGKPERF